MKRVILAMVALTLCAVCGYAATPQKNKKMEQVKHITQEEFKTLVADYEQSEWKYLGDKPAIVDFYATWCGPCRALAPVLEQIATEYKGKLVVYKVDVDKEPAVAAAFGVRSIPTLLFIPMEGKPYVSLGAMNAEQLREKIMHKGNMMCVNDICSTSYSAAPRLEGHLEVRFPHEGVVAVRQITGWGFVDCENRIVIEPQYDWVSDFCEGRAEVETFEGM
ncbi:MAG: thioredoxin, partial [Rikenellaceae bacterium]|nr:thioredoxin [Rikenellaceae bacterium]